MAKKKDITEDEPNVEKTKTSAEKRKPVEKKTPAGKSGKKMSGEAVAQTAKEGSYRCRHNGSAAISFRIFLV